MYINVIKRMISIIYFSIHTRATSKHMAQIKSINDEPGYQKYM